MKIFDVQLKNKIQSWLIGFLSLQRISWSSPTVILEKMFQYERVHPIQDWNDLKRRLGPGRRCFSFFHKSMPLDPLVFVQVALVEKVSDNVQKILNDENLNNIINHNREINCAIFYSINTQKGVSGVDLGSFLIKRVVIELQNEFPGLNRFITLSPIPFFRKWLIVELNKEASSNWFNKEELLRINQLIYTNHFKDNSTIKLALLELFENKNWTNNEKLCEILKLPMQKWVIRYLFENKRDIYVQDPVGKNSNIIF